MLLSLGAFVFGASGYLVAQKVHDAKCASNCKRDYHSAVANCKFMYDDLEDLDDARDREECIQSAKDDYGRSIADCKN